MSRAKIEEVTLDALRTRQSLVKGERLVRHDMRPVLMVLQSARDSMTPLQGRDGCELDPGQEQKTTKKGESSPWPFWLKVFTEVMRSRNLSFSRFRPVF